MLLGTRRGLTYFGRIATLLGWWGYIINDINSKSAHEFAISLQSYSTKVTHTYSPRTKQSSIDARTKPPSWKMAMHPPTGEALKMLRWDPQPPPVVSVSSSVSTHHFARQPPPNLAVQEIGVSLLWPVSTKGVVPLLYL